MSDSLPTLYIRDSKGKERFWSVRTEGAKIIVSYGQIGGKTTEKVTTAKAKNVGKSNETTPEQQAVIEAKAKWVKQVEREDYHEDIEKAGQQLRPMLALDYTKVPHRVDWSRAVGQPKLDGLRLTVGNRFVPGGYVPGEFEMLTRKGETYHVPHLIDPCNELLEKVNELVDGRCIALDGEAYIHGMPLQQIVSRAKKYHPGKTEELEFHLFDLVIPGMPFKERFDVLERALVSNDHESLSLVEYVTIPNHETLLEYHGKWTECGYEGAMIRHIDSEYGIAQRSPNLFKYKEFYDDEFLIVDVWEDNNGNAMFTLEAFDGQTLSCKDHVVDGTYRFNCTPKRPHTIRKAMLRNRDQYIGKWITVKYQDLTDDYVPSFPVGLALRDCDDFGQPIA